MEWKVKNPAALFIARHMHAVDVRKALAGAPCESLPQVETSSRLESFL